MSDTEEKECNIHFEQGNSDLLLQIDKKSDEVKTKLTVVQNKIKELCNLKNVSFLFGSGTSSPAIPTMSKLFEEFTPTEKSKELYNKLCNKEQKENKEQESENLETILGILYSGKNFIEGLHLVNISENVINKATIDSLIKEIEEHIFKRINILNLDSEISDDNDKVNVVLKTYKTFYKKIALRNKDLSRINIFTTNNDLFNETALDSLNIHYINGFNGGYKRYFNPAMFNHTFSKRMDTSIDKYEPVENLVYLYKLHGSINWKQDEQRKGNSYFDIYEDLSEKIEGEKEKQVLIYPTPMKQDKSLGAPYVDLFREFQHKLLEPHSVLFIIGYSFSDRHVNDVIYRALATNSTINIVIINDPNSSNGEMKKLHNIDDKRIFWLWGCVCKEEKEEDKSKSMVHFNSNDENTVHYFKYFVSKILPDINVYSKEDDILKDFISKIKEETNKNEDR